MNRLPRISLRPALLPALLALLALPAPASASTLDWTTVVSPSIEDMAVDPGGNTYFVSNHQTSTPYETGFRVARLDPEGTIVFSRSFSFAVWTERARAIATDAFAARIDAAGDLTEAEILGGSERGDVAWSVAVAPSGDVLVAGRTASEGFPAVVPFQGECSPQQPGCEGDGFLTRLDGTLSTILESTYFGGSAGDAILFAGTDAQGAVYLGGNSQSSDLPGGGGPGGFGARLVSDGQFPDCSAAVAEPSVIAPANGALVPVSVSGVTGPGGDPADLVFTAIRQDEPIGGGGPDATGVGTATASVRASRSGQGDGRVYHLEFRTTGPGGSTCSGEVQVCVPLSGQSPVCGDGGATADSTVTRPRNASLAWSTFLGGSGDEVKEAGVEIDASGS